MAISETKKTLIDGLNLLDIRKDAKIAIALMLKSEDQMLTMIDWLAKHIKENPEEDFVLAIAIRISEKVK